MGLPVQSNEVTIALILSRLETITETTKTLRICVDSVTEKLNNQERIRGEQLTRLEENAKALNKAIQDIQRIIDDVELTKTVAEIKSDVALLKRITFALGAALLSLGGSLVYYLLVNYVFSK